jgi:hypothetical protein
MGITIHYRGQLQDPASLPQLTQELQLACGRLGWPYQVIDERVVGTAEHHKYHHDPDGETIRVTVETTPLDDRWQGVVIQPPDCDTLWLTFNRSGQLILYDAPLEEREKPGRYHAGDHLWVKTQFSTPDIHIAVCSLLRLVEGYASHLEVIDEGDYWESGDRETLVARMEQLNAALTMLSSQAGLGLLGEMLGHEVEGEIEIGKQVTQPMPLWRRDWGVSAEEN